jgi:threonine-phosphate decarboxylase
MPEEILNDRGALECCENLYRLAEELGAQERKIIDFSTPVSPRGVSQKVKVELRKHLKYLHNYPDPDAKRLRKRLARYHDIEPQSILCGNGSTELVYLIARALKPVKILVPAPSFSEYERACRICCNPEVIYSELTEKNNFGMDTDVFVAAMKKNFAFPEEIRSSGPVGRGMIFLCNPHYPTGRSATGDDIRKIADAAKELGSYLVVDEAFIDFCAGASVIRDVADNPYLIVLRSMSPFYALSGLRIGYGVFHSRLIKNLVEHKEPWTVNSLAQRAAVTALQDKAYRKDTFRSAQEEKRFLEKNFRKLGITFFPSAANFYLLRMGNAREISLELKKRGILVMDCSSFRGLDSTYMGAAVKSHRENAVFLKELVKILHRRVEFQCPSGDG